MSEIVKGFETIGWRYARAEAPREPTNQPPDNRRKARLEFLETAVIFHSWEIPYRTIETANLFAPGMPLQVLRLTTATDVFEFLVGRHQLSSKLPFEVIPVTATLETEFGRGVLRARLAAVLLGVVTLGMVLWLLYRAA